MSHQTKTRQRWSEEELAFLIRHYADHKTAWIASQIGHTDKSIYQRARELGLRKSRDFLSSEASGRLQRKDHRGRLTQFKPGHPTWNKGMKGIDIGGKETRFKKGQKPHTWHPIGHERICDGYLQRKVTDTGITRRDYRPVHHLVWEAANGPIPDGHALVFRDGNRKHIVLENLELISRADLMRRNTRHNLPQPLNELVQLRAVITRRINKLTKDAA